MASRHLIMGTSGHVDHGKTALIRMLTGTDTDRLKEERERGISIELGFAHLDLASGIRLGIVDVPGHERFVKHMLAGAGGIDVVLLVVAADEGVMPQTVEHSQILELLGVERGLVALTKIDLVDPDLQELAREDVEAYLSSTPFASWPIVPVSATTGQGREPLLETIQAAAAEVPARSSEGLPRLPIDRVFTMEGFGTVVTGTLWEGSIAEGDQVVIQPGEKRARVRQVQSHGRKVGVCTAGSRVALALHGVARAEIERGAWVVRPGTHRPTSIVDVRLEVVASEGRPVRQRERLRFHLGASEVYGRVTLFDRDELPPGESDVAQIRLEAPVVTVRGDRFVVRRYSPVQTAGGGRIIDPRSRKRRRSEHGATAELELLDTGSTADRVLAAVSHRLPAGLTAGEIAGRIGCAEAQVLPAVDELARQGRIAGLGDARWVDADWRVTIDAWITEAAADYQRRHPLRYGIQLGELRSRFQGRLAPEAIDAAVAGLARAGKLHLREDRVRCGDPEMTLSASDSRAAESIKRILEAADFAVPPVKQLLAQAGDATEPQELLVYLANAGEIVRLTPELCYTRGQIQRLEEMVVEFFRRQPTMSVAEFKDMAGVSRKYAVPLLEYLDNGGLTRRSGDDRVPGRRLAAVSAGPT